MNTFIKANVSASIASALDYVISIGLVYFFKVDAVLSTVAGVVAGGVANFLMGSYWAFGNGRASKYREACRYLLVWLGNLLLNAGSMYFFTNYVLLHYAVVKIITALVIAWGYNYPLQRHYVFNNKSDDS